MSRHSDVRRRGPWRHVDLGPRGLARWQSVVGRKSRRERDFPPGWRPSARRYWDPPRAAPAPVTMVAPLSTYLGGHLAPWIVRPTVLS